MKTKNLIDALREKISAMLKMSMFKKAEAAQQCVVDSVAVIDSLNGDIETLNKKVEILLKALNEAQNRLNEHIKTGR